MSRSDLMKFWKLLADTKFTSRPSLLTEDDVRKLADADKVVMFEPEIEAVLRGWREMLENGKG
jgi:hypothetical protein